MHLWIATRVAVLGMICPSCDSASFCSITASKRVLLSCFISDLNHKLAFSILAHTNKLEPMSAQHNEKRTNPLRHNESGSAGAFFHLLTVASPICLLCEVLNLLCKVTFAEVNRLKWADCSCLIHSTPSCTMSIACKLLTNYKLPSFKWLNTLYISTTLESLRSMNMVKKGWCVYTQQQCEDLLKKNTWEAVCYRCKCPYMALMCSPLSSTVILFILSNYRTSSVGSSSQCRELSHWHLSKMGQCR